MPVIVNDHEISDAEVMAELPQHQDAANPTQRATTAVILRHLLRADAAQRNIDTDNEEEMLEVLLDQVIVLAPPSEAECLRYYTQHPERFTVGELVEAEHILFQVTPSVDLDALRRRAEKTLAEIRQQPTRFAEFARNQSNCSSGSQGGNLGQLTRGATVPEFEKALFSLEAGALYPQLLETRFGLHILRCVRRIDGRLLPYETAKSQIAATMRAAQQDMAWRQYVQKLVSAATISGVEMEGALAPLVQ